MAGCWRVRIVGVVAAAVTAWAAVAAAPLGAQSAGFDDVAEDAYYSVPVAALTERGIFAGTECAQGFCPNDPIDRKTMAVWVVRVLDGEEPPAVSESSFSDVDAAGFHAPFIERLAELGATRGCGDGTGFCPDRVVSRAQMAVFLTRAYGLPAGPDPGFSDVPGDAWYAAEVASLAASGITHGCGDGTGFCPEQDTSRAHMATFIHRAENPASTLISLEVAAMTPLTSIGETVQLSSTANMSDGSRRDIESALVQWQSSDPWVASVSEGLVTAVGGGNAMITAAYDGRTLEVPVSVRVSTKSAGSVRVIYAAPSDREFRADMSEFIANAMVDLQSWYRRELGGLTFSIYEATPEECRMSEPADYYVRGNAWEKVMEGLQPCAPVQHDSPDFIWVVFPIVREPCDEPQELGAGGAGLTIMPVNNGAPVLGEVQDECGEGSYFITLGSKIGGPGHELGHTLGLPHPPGCDAGLPTCDYGALMGSGNYSYPETYLRADDKEVLIRSPFIGVESLPGRNSLDAPNASSVHGVALWPDREPVEGLRVSLVAESSWSWGETGQDGTFAIRVPESSSGPSILSVHAGDAGDCRWLGYHSPDGVTTARAQATRVDIGNGNVTGIEIRLPVDADDLCPKTRKVTGTVLGPDGEPVEGIWLPAGLGWVRTGVDGTFEFSVPEDRTYSVLSIHADEVPDCGLVGYFGSEGFTTLSENAWLEIGGIGAPGIEIRLPATPDELCREQITLTGAVLGLDGEPLGGIGIGLMSETGFYPWEWGETGPDGTFEIRLLGAWSGSLVLAVHAAEVAWPCSLLGYYGPGGFTATRGIATRLEASDVDASGIEIRLPASPDQLLPYRVSGYRCSGPVGHPAALGGSAGADSIRIPLHNWSSQTVGARVVGGILEEAGFSVEYVPSDSQVVYQSMCDGDIELVHEVWEGAFGVAFQEQVDKGCVLDWSTHNAVTREEWWYPVYVEEQCPGLPDWEALNACASIFATAETGDKGRYLGAPADWLTGDAERVEGLGMDFEVINAASSDTLWMELEAASADNAPIVLHNWTPHFVEAVYEGRFIEFPTFEDACRTDPEWGTNSELTHDCGNPDGYLKIGVGKHFPEKWPTAAAIVQRMDFTNAMLAAMAAAIDVDGKRPSEAAIEWLAANGDLWQGWITG